MELDCGASRQQRPDESASDKGIVMGLGGDKFFETGSMAAEVNSEPRNPTDLVIPFELEGEDCMSGAGSSLAGDFDDDDDDGAPPLVDPDTLDAIDNAKRTEPGLFVSGMLTKLHKFELSDAV